MNASFPSSGGGGGSDPTALKKASNLADLTDATAARGNLGLGSSATHPTTDFDAAGAATAAVVTAEAYADTGDALAAKKAANLSDLANATTARTNLGLGTAAVKDVAASGNASTLQVVKGDDTRLADTRTPTDGTVTAAKLATGAVTSTAILDGTIADADVNAAAAIAESKLALATDAAAGTGSRRTLGTGALQAAAGNDSRLSDSRAPSGAASGDLTGSYPGPTLVATGPGATGPTGDSTHVAQVTIDAKGRVTALASVAISGAAATLRRKYLVGLGWGDTGVLMGSGVLAPGINVQKGLRIQIPAGAALLREIYIFVGTSSGNFLGGVYDTGQANGADHTVATLLTSFTSVASATGWLKLGDANLAVAEGDQYDLTYQCDNATATVLRDTIQAAAQAQLPDILMAPPHGTGLALPKLAWTNTPGGFALPATLTEVTKVVQAQATFLLARVA